MELGKEDSDASLNDNKKRKIPYTAGLTVNTKKAESSEEKSRSKFSFAKPSPDFRQRSPGIKESLLSHSR